MKIVLTCGHPTSGYQMVHRVLLDCGLSQANSSRREQFSAEDIQRKLCLAHDIPAIASGEIIQVNPGKVWQNLAVDLFVANLEAENWGWADVNTVYLLDFWHEFDPQLRFVLTYSSPATALVKLGEVAEDQVRELVKDALRSWFFFNDQLLRFYSRHQDRCLLINADAVARVEGQEKLLPLLREQRGLSLSTQIVKATPSERPQSAIIGLITSQILDEMPEIQSLYDELEGSADIFSGESYARSVLAEMAVAEYQRLEKLLAAGRTALEQVATEKDRVQQESGEKLSAAESKISMLERAAIQHRNEAEQARKNEERLKQREQENELLLLQLYQLQEELESYVLKAKELDREKEKAKQLAAANLSAVEKTLAAREKEIEQYKREVAQRKRELESAFLRSQELTAEKDRMQTSFTKEMSAMEHGLSARAGEVEQYKKEVAQKKKELEMAMLRANEFAAEKDKVQKSATEKIATLQQKLSSHEGEVEQCKKDAVQAKQREEKLKREIEESTQKASKARELEQESQLLLLQLNQVQEELENYYTKYQELTSNKQALSCSADAKRFSPVVIDMRGNIQAENWYAVEKEGRWAGPERVSTITIPPLEAGQYRIELDVGDAMNPSILQNTAVSFNGRRLFFIDNDGPRRVAAASGGSSAKGSRYPVRWQTIFSVGSADMGQFGKLRFEFPSLLSPAATGTDDARKLAIFLRAVRISPLPGEEIVGIDLRDTIDGTNWYEPEVDGRWAGPGPVSSLCFPPVKPGRYRLGLEIVDAMAPEILNDVRCEFAGTVISLVESSPRSWLARVVGRRRRYPVMLAADVQISPEQCANDLTLSFTFNKLISPASRGSTDQRKLALRLRHVTLRPLATS